MGRAILAGFIFLVLFSACSKDKVPNDNCPATCPTISFKADIIPIFRANCALSGCHLVASSANGNVALDSTDAWASATQPGVGYVVP